MTIAIKTLRKTIAFHDAITRALDSLRASLGNQRVKWRDKLSDEVQKLLDVEYELQRKVINEPFELRDKLLKEYGLLVEYFTAESNSINEQLRELDSEANKAERSARQDVIKKRIAELHKLIV